MNFSAVILAGGKSSRMGRDKAWLEVRGQTLLARQIELARETGAAEIFISGRADADYSAFGGRVLQDKFPDAGPLAGVQRALDAAKSPLLLVLAVDLPEMRAEFLLRLAADCSDTCGAIPKLTGRVEPLAAFYPKAAQSLAVASLERKNFAVKDFAERCVKSGLARFFKPPVSEARYFANWNSRADLASAASSSKSSVSPSDAALDATLIFQGKRMGSKSNARRETARSTNRNKNSVIVRQVKGGKK